MAARQTLLALLVVAAAGAAGHAAAAAAGKVAAGSTLCCTNTTGYHECVVACFGYYPREQAEKICDPGCQEAYQCRTVPGEKCPSSSLHHSSDLLNDKVAATTTLCCSNMTGFQECVHDCFAYFPREQADKICDPGCKEAYQCRTVSGDKCPTNSVAGEVVQQAVATTLCCSNMTGFKECVHDCFGYYPRAQAEKICDPGCKEAYQCRTVTATELSAATELVAPVVSDDKGHEITRTMRMTDKLQDLMDFYYAMVPAVPRGKGVFLYQGKRVDGERTPASYEMKSGDKIEFLAEMKQSMFIDLTVQDGEGRRVTRTMRRTEKLRVLMDFYRAMVMPASTTTPCVEGVFMFKGTLVEGERTPEYYRMEDGAQIDFSLSKIKPSATFVTLSVADIDGRKVTRTMRTTDKLQDLMDFYYDSLPIVATEGGKFALDGETVRGWETPKELGMEDGYALDFCFPENCFICNGDLSRLDLLFKRR